MYENVILTEQQIQDKKNMADVVIHHDLEYGQSVLIETVDGGWIEVTTESFAKSSIVIKFIEVKTTEEKDYV